MLRLLITLAAAQLTYLTLELIINEDDKNEEKIMIRVPNKTPNHLLYLGVS